MIRRYSQILQEGNVFCCGCGSLELWGEIQLGQWRDTRIRPFVERTLCANQQLACVLSSIFSRGLARGSLRACATMAGQDPKEHDEIRYDNNMIRSKRVAIDRVIFCEYNVKSGPGPASRTLK
jgi:hypothetical protein